MLKVLRKVGFTTVAIALAIVLGLVGQGQARAVEIPASSISGYVFYGDDGSNQLHFTATNNWVLDPPIRPTGLSLYFGDNFSHTGGDLYIQIRFNDHVAWQLGNIDSYGYSCVKGDESTFVKTLQCHKDAWVGDTLNLGAMYVQDDVSSIDITVGTDDYIDFQDPGSDAGGSSNSNWTKDDIKDVKDGVKDINKNLTDSNVNSSNMANTIGGIKIQPVGIVTTAITAVVKLPTLLTNRQACQPLDLGELLGHDIQADCVSSQVNHKLWTTAGIIADFLTAVAIFYVVIKIATSIYLAKDDPVGIAGGNK